MASTDGEPREPVHVGTSSTIAPNDFSFPLRLSPHTTLHIQLTSLATSTLIFLTTKSPANPSSVSALGSFVYAMPNVSLLKRQPPPFFALNSILVEFRHANG